jgi:hypothetical protein
MAESPSPKPFQLTPKNCVVSITLYPIPGEPNSFKTMVYSTLGQSLQLSKTLLDDIERKAIIRVIQDMLANHAVNGVNVNEEGYSAGLAEALGIDEILVRVKKSEEPLPPTVEGPSRNQEDLSPAERARFSKLVDELSEATVALINAERKYKVMDEELRAAKDKLTDRFRGVSKQQLEEWAATVDPRLAEEMREVWQQANEWHRS